MVLMFKGVDILNFKRDRERECDDSTLSMLNIME